MKKFVPKSLCFLILLFNCCLLHAQLNADFVMSTNGGCTPLKITFSNASTGTSSGTTYKWDFGNSNTSVLLNTSAVYFTEGKYTVTLTANDGTKTSVRNKEISVYKKPVADFTWSSSKGCSPLTINFSSTSVAGDGSLTNYYWDFGDGSTQQSFGPTISHVYLIPQKATVTLTAVNQYGCYNTITKNDIIEVLEPLIPAFSVDKAILCRISDTVRFTNTSKGPGTLSYLWDFGDGNSSTVINPKYVFNKKGYYTIKLTVTSSEGCINSIVQNNYINVADFKSDFNLPPDICQNNQLIITNQSTPNPSQTVWNMGDGNLNYYSYPFNYSYNQPGNYTVKLINTFGTCIDSVSKNIRIKPYPALNGFINEITSVCGAPVLVKFKDTTATAVKWEWDFSYDYYNSKISSTIQAPSYTYTSDGYYNTRLKVENAEGCSNSIIKSIQITRPWVNIFYTASTSNLGTNSCGPVTISFASNSSEQIVKYDWIFSDGGNSTDATPTHTFTNKGSTVIRLNYTTVNGCTGTANFYTSVNVYEKPVADFTSLSGTKICGNSVVEFQSTSTGNINYHYWVIDGRYAGNSYYNRFSYQFYTAGKHTIQLIVWNDGCRDTMTKVDYIEVFPPFAKINGVQNTCAGNRDVLTFTDGSKDATAWQWNFGDNITATYTTAQPSITHTYTNTGSYKIVLAVTNGSCTVKDSSVAYVWLKQKPLLTAAKTSLCSEEGLNYTLSNLEKAPYPGIWASYFFDKFEYGDGTRFMGTNSTYDNIVNPIPYSGQLNYFEKNKDKLRVIIRNGYFGCADTSNYIPLTINGATAGFEVTTDKICFKSPVLFRDTSTSTAGNAILSWQWNFGDGNVQTFAQGGAVSHLYANPGGYYVTLKVTDASGCTSSTSTYSKYVQVNGPKAAFNTSGTNVPLNTTVYFYNNTNAYGSSNTQYQWDFGDGNSSNVYYPSNIYTRAGTYTIRLITTDIVSGCSSEAIQTITVRNFNSAFSFNTSFVTGASCPPVIARFNNTSAGAVSVTWNFGDGTTAGNVNYPSHTYPLAGKYIITLYVYGDNGLKGTYTDSVTVNEMQAKSQFNPTEACVSQQVNFKTKASGVDTYLWDFGDGVLSASKDSAASHFYKSPGIYTPVLIVTNTEGCSVAIPAAEKIIIDSLSIGIKGIPTQICNQAKIFFNADVYSIGASQSADFLKYTWNFGTGNAADTANIINPVFNYTSPGTYTVTLKVNAKSGCVKEVKETITVKQSSKGTITGPSEICPGKTAQFTATASIANAVQWAWDFKNGQTINTQNASPQLYTNPGNYNITLIINNQGCYDTAIHQLTVRPNPAIQLSPKETLICLGKSVQLNASGGTIYQWTPATGLSNPQTASPIAAPSATTNYLVKVTNGFGCSLLDSAEVKVAQPFKITAKLNYTICAGDKVLLSAQGASLYKWINNTQGLSNTLSGSVTATPAFTSLYTVVGYDDKACFTDTAEINVVVNSRPLINAGPDIESMPGNPVQLKTTGSNDIIKWTWQPPDFLSCTQCPSPISTATRTVSYIVNALNANNCMASDTITIKILCSGGQILIPNAFTPNNDAKNDVFYVMGNGASLLKHFIIYDRWGTKVFERNNVNVNDISGGWDGKYKGLPATNGSYVYFAELVCNTTGETFLRQGTVLLIR